MVLDAFAREADKVTCAAIATLMLCGCGIESRPNTPGPTSTAQQSAASEPQPGDPDYDENQMMLDAIAKDYGLNPVPDVAVVRVVSNDERDRVITHCMAEHGFVADSAGQLGATEDQAQAFGLAQYVCWAQYPLDPKYWARPMTPELLTKLYHYWVDVQVPCLEDLGYAIPEAPSLASWLGGEEWAPYYYAIPTDEKDRQRLQALCPDEPPDFYD